MAVLLSPAASLGFNRPFQDPVKRTLTVSNRNKDPIAFKVKTTAPRAYCVRPNAGRIEPDESVDIQVILQAMREDPPMTAKCKDKFLVQSMTMSPNMHDLSLAEVWSYGESDPTNHPIHHQRIKVVLLPPEGYRVEETEEPPNDSTFLSVNDSRYDTVRQFPVANGSSHLTAQIVHATAPPMGHAEDTLERVASPALDFHAAHEIPAPIAAVAPSIPPVTPATAAPQSMQIHNGTAAPGDEAASFKIKYADAQEEIARLRALLASMPEPSAGGHGPDPEGLRRRNVGLKMAGADESIETGDDDDDLKKNALGVGMHQEGVPPQVVAIIALVVFTLTYLFF